MYIRTRVEVALRRETNPRPTADIKVPAKAKVRMEPKLRKKLSYYVTLESVLPSRTNKYLFHLIPRVENDGRQK